MIYASAWTQSPLLLIWRLLAPITHHESFLYQDGRVLTFNIDFSAGKRSNNFLGLTIPIAVFIPNIQFAENISPDTVIVPSDQSDIPACLEAGGAPEHSRPYTIPVFRSMFNVTNNATHNEIYQALLFHFKQNTNRSCYIFERPTQNINYIYAVFIEKNSDINSFYRVSNRSKISIFL